MLTQAQYDSKLASQSAIARKVLSVVPIAEAWTRQQIHTELHRATSATIDGRTIDGCLRSLEECGLAKQPSPGRYQAIRPHEKAQKGQEADKPVPTGIVDAELPQTGAAVLARQAQVEGPRRSDAFTLFDPEPAGGSIEHLLDRMGNLSDRLLETAAEIDSIRKRIRAELNGALAKSAKLDELTKLLDSLRP